MEAARPASRSRENSGNSVYNPAVTMGPFSTIILPLALATYVSVYLAAVFAEPNPTHHDPTKWILGLGSLTLIATIYDLTFECLIALAGKLVQLSPGLSRKPDKQHVLQLIISDLTRRLRRTPRWQIRHMRYGHRRPSRRYLRWIQSLNGGNVPCLLASITQNLGLTLQALTSSYARFRRNETATCPLDATDLDITSLRTPYLDERHATRLARFLAKRYHRHLLISTQGATYTLLPQPAPRRRPLTPCAVSLDKRHYTVGGCRNLDSSGRPIHARRHRGGLDPSLYGGHLTANEDGKYTCPLVHGTSQGCQGTYNSSRGLMSHIRNTYDRFRHVFTPASAAWLSSNGLGVCNNCSRIYTLNSDSSLRAHDCDALSESSSTSSSSPSSAGRRRGRSRTGSQPPSAAASAAAPPLAPPSSAPLPQAAANAPAPQAAQPAPPAMHPAAAIAPDPPAAAPAAAAGAGADQPPAYASYACTNAAQWACYVSDILTDLNKLLSKKDRGGAAASQLILLLLGAASRYPWPKRTGPRSYLPAALAALLSGGGPDPDHSADAAQHIPGLDIGEDLEDDADDSDEDDNLPANAAAAAADETKALSALHSTLYRAICHLAAGDVRRASRELDSHGLANISDAEVRKAIQELYPEPAQLPAPPANAVAAAAAPPANAAAAAPKPKKPKWVEVTAEATLAVLKRTDPRSAGGLSGWTYNLIRIYVKLRPNDAMDLLAPLLSAIANNAVPKEGATALRRLRGIPAYKEPPAAGTPPQIRPLGLPEVFVKLTESVLVHQARPTLERLTNSGTTEFGFGGGSELLPLAVRTLLNLHPDWVVIKGDIRNGFGTLSRPAILKAAEAVPELIALSHFLYDTPAEVTFAQPASSANPAANLITSLKVGVAQGGASSPAFYALTCAPAFATARKEHPDVTILSVLDDSFIIGPPALAFQAHATLDRERSKLGQELRPNKSKAYCPQPQNKATLKALAKAANVPLQTGWTGPNAGIAVAGTHVGSPEFEGDGVNRVLADTLRVCNAFGDAATNDGFRVRLGMPVLQGCVMAIRLCVSSKFQYAMATYPPNAVKRAALSIDECVFKTLHRILGSNYDWRLAFDPHSDYSVFRLRTFLPTRHGGMGFTSCYTAHRAAYIGNWARNGQTLSQIIPELLDPGQNVDGEVTARHAVGLYEALTDLQEEEGESEGHDLLRSQARTLTVESILTRKTPKIQAFLTEAMYPMVKGWILSLLGPIETANFTSNAGIASSAWLRASPKHRSTSMTDEEFRIAYLFRLGDAMLPPHLPAPGSLAPPPKAVGPAVAAAAPAASAAGPAGPGQGVAPNDDDDDPPDPPDPPAPAPDLNPAPKTCPKCSKPLVSHDHALRCSIANHYTRHNLVRDAAHNICRLIPNTASELEPSLDAHFTRTANSEVGPEGLRADLLVTKRSTNGSRHSDFLDFTIVTVTPSLSAAKKKSCSAPYAKEAARVKSNKYSTNYELSTANGIHAGTVVPLATESSGAMDPAAYKWWCTTARRGVPSGPLCHNDFAFRLSSIMQRLSVAQQKGNAQMFLAWQNAAFPAPLVGDAAA